MSPSRVFLLFLLCCGFVHSQFFYPSYGPAYYPPPVYAYPAYGVPPPYGPYGYGYRPYYRNPIRSALRGALVGATFGLLGKK